MTEPRHAVVIGASFAGLLAAAALREAYPRVTVYERDTLPGEPQARRGVPQGRQVHLLMVRGVQAMGELLPGLNDDVLAAGGLVADPQADMRYYIDDYPLKSGRSGIPWTALTRVRLEDIVRKRVAALPGITIVDGTDVVRLVTDGARVTGVTVGAARTQGAAEEDVPADLVVDAAGSGSRTTKWLADLGREAPRTSRVMSRVTYVSRLYRRDPKQLDGRFGIAVTAYPGKPFSGAILRQEDDRWMVTFIGMVGTDVPVDEAGWLDFADRLVSGDLAAVMRESEPLSEPMRYTYPGSTRHHYEELNVPLARLLVIGDALCSFNPAYGQGISVAALEALELRKLVNAGEEDLERRYFRAAGKVVGDAWKNGRAADLRFPEIEGKRGPADAFGSFYGGLFNRAISVDPELATTFLRVANMLESPAKLMAPGNVLRVLRSYRKAVRATRPEV